MSGKAYYVVKRDNKYLTLMGWSEDLNLAATYSIKDATIASKTFKNAYVVGVSSERSELSPAELTALNERQLILTLTQSVEMDAEAALIIKMAVESGRIDETEAEMMSDKAGIAWPYDQKEEGAYILVENCEEKRYWTGNFWSIYKDEAKKYENPEEIAEIVENYDFSCTKIVKIEEK